MTKEQREAEEEREKTRKKLLAAEAAALLLFRRNRAVVLATRRRSLSKATDDLRAAILGSVVEARGLARVAGSRRVTRELRAFGWDGDVPDPVTRAADEAIATLRAHSQIERWLLLRKRALDDGHREESARLLAWEQLDSRRRVTAASEVSEAFTNERARVLRLVERPDWVKFWDATLDRRTCPTCAGMNGRWVPLDSSFPFGTPGAVHAYCRCIEVVGPRSWAEAVDLAA